jgi:glucose-1-phosphate thymidylyltransferase
VTYAEPKQILPVAGIPVLLRAIRDLSDAGIDDICVVLGDNGREQVRETLEASQLEACLSYVVQGPARGLADAIDTARDFVGDEPFVVHFGDVVLSESIDPLIESFDPRTEAARLGVNRVDDPAEHAIVEVNSGQAVRVHEKPDEFHGRLSPVVDIFTPRIFDAIHEITPSERGELEIMDAIQRLIDDGQNVGVTELPGWWEDTGTPEGFLTANRRLLEDADASTPGVIPADERIEGPIILDNGARLATGTTVTGPVSVASGVVLEDSAAVGPAVSVGAGAKVAGATVKNSVICESVRVAVDRTLVESILPRGVQIEDVPDGDCRFLLSRDAHLSLP